MKQKNSWLVLFFGGAGIVTALVLRLILSDIFSLLGVADKAILGHNFLLSHAVAFVLAVCAVFFFAVVYRPSRLFVEQAIAELDKVAWPTAAQTRQATWTVIVVSTVASLILGVFDAVFVQLTSSGLF
ncbi:MAG: preprotein translocase subunit SecE [Myxococcota bacterium]